MERRSRLGGPTRVMPTASSDPRHRKALRAASLELSRLAGDMRHRRGHLPDDEPMGYVTAFSIALSHMARTVQTLSRSETCADAKRRVMALVNPEPIGTAGGLAHDRAVSAAVGAINQCAREQGLDPFEGRFRHR